MKLYTHYNEKGHVLVHRVVPDDVTLAPPFVLRSAEDLAALTADQPPPFRGVPESVTPRQIRRVLNAHGLRAAVEAAVAAAPQDVRDEWEYALEIRRDYPLMTAMAAQLGLTDEQLDDLFRAAATY